MISTPALPPLNAHSTPARDKKITTENSHAIYPPKGKKGRQREAFMKKENESAHRAPQRVRHSNAMALETKKKGDAFLPDLCHPPLPPALLYTRLFKDTNL